MDFRQLEYFEAVVKAGSVSQAAKALNMTQPPLSSAISRLEQEVGVQLLVRSPHGVRPTSAGRYLLSQGGMMLAARNRVERVLKLMGTGLLGELRIGAEPMVIHEVIADVLSSFAALAPDVRVALTDTNPRAVLEGLGTGEFDIGCIPWAPEDIATPIRERFDWLPLRKIDLRLAVPAARAAERHPEGRDWGRWILPHRVPGMPGMLEAVESELAGTPSFDSILVSNPQTAIPLVAAGIGVSPSTERICAHDPRVGAAPPPRWLKPMQVTLALRKGTERTPLITRWLDLATSMAGSDRATKRLVRATAPS
ncbi:LysR family transcriptional regulator [Leucobacter sp. CSA1]|uniref:LysR family transcriptional regulator n=1 Tax=Leucobacter chromiisoli TaxID=2796471 RepID=A0A934UUE2_9MICO|nr:LysR family transcriptional regulator [Leucobacter chromiisoli]MBK0419389.1 LysR family transcriptional regulator [Leucobacter chromiisoli]